MEHGYISKSALVTKDVTKADNSRAERLHALSNSGARDERCFTRFYRIFRVRLRPSPADFRGSAQFEAPKRAKEMGFGGRNGFA
jgi:hypothetical protein